MLFDEKIVALEQALERAGIPHAFGGANAFAYYGIPRATADIDLNVFVPTSRAREVLAVLGALGVSTSDPALVERIDRDGQARVFWEKTPIDLFFSYDALHDSSMERRRAVDFGGDTIHVLSAEDLVPRSSTQPMRSSISTTFAPGWSGSSRTATLRWAGSRS
jgi:hypothetical protein